MILLFLSPSCFMSLMCLLLQLVISLDVIFPNTPFSVLHVNSPSYFLHFTCSSCSPCSRSLHHMTHTTSVVTTTWSALTWITNVLRCLIQCVRQLMQTLLRMLNSSSTTSKRHGTVTTKTQRSRSDIFQLSTWRLRSKGTRNFLSLSSCALYTNPTPLFVTSELKFIIAMSVLFASSPDSFSCAGRTVAFTCWNT